MLFQRGVIASLQLLLLSSSNAIKSKGVQEPSVCFIVFPGQSETISSCEESSFEGGIGTQKEAYDKLTVVDEVF